ncbi:hypothetical protein ES703_25092 [subsurface metagenome]
MVVKKIDTMPLAVGEGHLPIDLFAYQAIGQGTWTIVKSASGIDGVQLANTSTVDGDEISYNAYLAAGTYTLRAYFRQNDSQGIVSFDIDADEVASFDNYAVADSWNNVQEQADIVVATSGLKSITVRLDGKHGSSADYQCYLEAFCLWRTA